MRRRVKITGIGPVTSAGIGRIAFERGMAGWSPRNATNPSEMGRPFEGAIGNPLAAAGPIQVACVALSFRSEFIQPTVTWLNPDPEFSLNLGREAREIGFDHARVHAHGITGTNSTLMLARR